MAKGHCTNPDRGPGATIMKNGKPFQCTKVGPNRYVWRIMKKTKKGYKPDKSLPGAIESIYSD